MLSRLFAFNLLAGVNLKMKQNKTYLFSAYHTLLLEE